MDGGGLERGMGGGTKASLVVLQCSGDPRTKGKLMWASGSPRRFAGGQRLRKPPIGLLAYLGIRLPGTNANQVASLAGILLSKMRVAVVL